MRKVLLTICLASFAFLMSNAQIKTPAASQMCKIQQDLGLTTVSLEYSRPNVNGRKLFVDVEAWDQMWRTGANGSTKIEFGDDAMIGGQKVKKGKYAIYSIPNKENWTVMLTSDLGMGGNVSKYNTANEVARFKTKTMDSPYFYETLTFEFSDIKNDGADLNLMWGDYMITMPIVLNTDEQVMASIESAMKGVSQSEYYAAASYYYANDKDLNQALQYVQKANENDPKFYMVYKEAQILADLGKYKDALMASQKSMDLARAADYKPYIKRNEDFIKKYASMAK
jgi:hypothetical protein